VTTPSGTRGLECLAITGPTACGKTDIALALAREFPIEIISMDSAMVYQGMDIGTAKPDRSIREAVPHHLIDILDPEEAYSAGRFADDATRLVAEISARGRLPLIVGGTMLYLKALREGIAPLPGRNPGVRAAIDARAKSSGWPALHAELAAVDPDAAARIEPADRQRIQRALEVHAVTGRPLSELQRSGPAPEVIVDSVALVPRDREALKTTIERRFDSMVEQGLIDEVRRLRERPGLTAASASMRAVGYRQIWEFLEGRRSLTETRERAVVATRQLAKRQLTWLRGDRLTEPLEADDPGLVEGLAERVRRHLEIA
jgi:tRNA dimethylallyltransferase